VFINLTLYSFSIYSDIHVDGIAGNKGGSSDVIKNQDFTKFSLDSLQVIMSVAEDMLGRGLAEEAKIIIEFLKMASQGDDQQKKQFIKG
jgi:hypothetical protein